MKHNFWVSVCAFWLVSLSVNAQQIKFEWVKQWGIYSFGAGFQAANMIGWSGEPGGIAYFNKTVTDHAGAVYVLGSFAGTFNTDPDATEAGIISSSRLLYESFLIKFNSAGKFQWAKALPISFENRVQGLNIMQDIIIDKNNDVVVLSHYFDTVISVHLWKLNSNGEKLWEKNFDPSKYLEVAAFTSLAADSNGDLYFGGFFTGHGPLPLADGTFDFDPGSGVHTLTPKEYEYDFFLLKLNSQGEFVWVKQFGGFLDPRKNSNPEPIRISLTNDMLYVTGQFSGNQDFDPGPDKSMLSSQLISRDGYGVDTFVAGFNTSGELNWVHRIGNDYNENIFATTTDPAGNLLFTGKLSGQVILGSGEKKQTFSMAQYADFYVGKLNSSGDFLWVKSIQNNSSSGYGVDIATDKFGSIYMTGQFLGAADFDPGEDKYELTAQEGSGTDIFFLKLNSNGTFDTAFSYGREGDDVGYGINVDKDGNILLTASYTGPGTIDVDPNETKHELKPSFSSLFIVKLSQPNLTASCSLSAGGIKAATDKLCAGGSIQLSANASEGKTPYGYQWQLDGKNIGENRSEFTATAWGGYTVKVTDAEGCTVTSPSFRMVQGTPPPAPVLSAEHSELLSGQTSHITSSVLSGFTFQWLKEGAAIDGATQSSYTAASPGVYSLRITDAGGCSSVSREITLQKSIITALEPGSAGAEITFYPNPVSSIAKADIKLYQPSTIKVMILNTEGKKLYRHQVKTVSNAHVIMLDLSKFHSGMYILNVESEYASYSYKIIKY